ncbi:uncharacterized protein H6S33_009606 [Morchella sextelata]|uniref:uncharacterized protein n=2 Tax=Morchella sextelata TaxID=1174677 RepID=UPI001D039A23|nr:uncharacterized protein H6S33_009606 [Morchella sextelata]KAH0613226.1 hypothetical protein H6S33_009606 [Morchella sextelata]
MSALSAPDAPLQIEWQPVPLQLDATGQTQLVKKPRTALQTYIPGCEPAWQDTDEISVQQFFTELQTYLQHSLQNQLTRGSQALLLVQERQAAQNALMAEALEYMRMEVNSVQEELRKYVEKDELNADAMEIEWTNPATPPDFVAEIQRALDEGRLVVARPATPAPNPVSRSSSRAATRTMQRKASPFAAFPVRSTRRVIPIVQPAVGASPLPPSRFGGVHPLLGGTDRSFDYEGEFFSGAGRGPPSPLARNPGRFTMSGAAQPAATSPLASNVAPVAPVAPPAVAAAPPPAQAQGGSSGNQNPPAQAQGGSGGNQNPPPPVARAPAPGDSDSSDSSDSEPEGGDRRGWRRYLKKKLEKQQKNLLAMMSQQFQPPTASPSSSTTRAREPKAPPPSKFQGKAEQVETFIRQCENVFSIESLSFTSEEVKIRYAGNLMEGEAAIRWYEAYHNSIDQASANRLAGMPVSLDLRWKRWDSFVDAFRAAFGEAISRDDAVAQWNALTHTARGGIDLFLNTIIQLMWKTGYEGQLVDDKIHNSLLPDLGMSWALFNPKPKSLMERIAALRELGHTHERYQGMAAEKAHPRTKKDPPAQKDQQPKRKREAASSSGPQKTPGPKDKAVELKGIPGDILEERMKAEVCLKCGKSRHKWTDCWSKQPTVVRVAAVRVQKRKRGKGNSNSQKKAKVAAVVAEDPLVVLPEVTEDFVFQPEQDSDNEIIW